MLGPFGMGGGDEKREPKGEPLWEALSVTLQELASSYVHGVGDMPGLPYRRGDIVNLRSGCSAGELCGRPAVVVEVRAPDEDRDELGPRRRDTRIIVFDQDHDFIPFWVESWQLEIHVPKEDVLATSDPSEERADAA